VLAILQQLKRRILPWGLSFILAIALRAGCAIALFTVIFTVNCHVATAQSTQKTGETALATPSARDAFNEAYQNRYTWDEQFPGYSAEVSLNYQGQLHHGIVRVKPDLSVEVININREDVREFVANQLRMETIHRRRVPFEKMHGQNSFKLEGTDDSGALKIQEVGDKMESHYKVKDKLVTQVNRVMGPVAVTVDTLGTAKNPEGYLVTHFQTVFRDAETGEVLEKEDVRDFHEKIGKYYLLTNRDIRSTKQGNPEEKLAADILIRFNDVQPL